VIEREQLFSSRDVAIARLNGSPRQIDTGRHKRALVYVGADVTVPELVRLLRGTADALAKSLPQVAP
jgi:hypothetical protein